MQSLAVSADSCGSCCDSIVNSATETYATKLFFKL